MTLLRRFLRLPSRERSLLIRAALLLCLNEVLLRLLSASVPKRLEFQGSAVPWMGKAGSFSPERIAWAVKTASRYVPGATCLPQALTTHRLLRWNGFSSLFRIGVMKDEQGDFQAHAWVEHQGQVLVGGADTVRYRSLLALGGSR